MSDWLYVCVLGQHSCMDGNILPLKDGIGLQVKRLSIHV